jgi:hypothetical protein
VGKKHRRAFVYGELDKLAAGLSCECTFTRIYNSRRHRETVTYVKKQRVILWAVLGGILEREIHGVEG